MVHLELTKYMTIDRGLSRSQIREWPSDLGFRLFMLEVSSSNLLSGKARGYLSLWIVSYCIGYPKDYKYPLS